MTYKNPMYGNLDLIDRLATKFKAARRQRQSWIFPPLTLRQIRDITYVQVKKGTQRIFRASSWGGSFFTDFDKYGDKTDAVGLRWEMWPAGGVAPNAVAQARSQVYHQVFFGTYKVPREAGNW